MRVVSVRLAAGKVRPADDDLPLAAGDTLVLSGLPPEPFLFEGFLPPRAGARQAALGRLKALEQAGLAASLIFYEAPHRLAESLAETLREKPREQIRGAARREGHDDANGPRWEILRAQRGWRRQHGARNQQITTREFHSRFLPLLKLKEP